MPLLKTQSFNGQDLLGASSEVISHPTSLAFPSHPSAWLQGCLPGSSCFCTLLPLTGSPSVVSVLYLFLGVLACYEEPLLLFLPLEMDYPGHISGLKLFVGGKVILTDIWLCSQVGMASLGLFSKELSVFTPTYCSYILNH